MNYVCWVICFWYICCCVFKSPVAVFSNVPVAVFSNSYVAVFPIHMLLYFQFTSCCVSNSPVPMFPIHLLPMFLIHLLPVFPIRLVPVFLIHLLLVFVCITVTQHSTYTTQILCILGILRWSWKWTWETPYHSWSSWSYFWHGPHEWLECKGHTGQRTKSVDCSWSVKLMDLNWLNVDCLSYFPKSPGWSIIITFCNALQAVCCSSSPMVY